MEEKNELNDIILNRSTNNGGMKKVMLFVAALAVLLIIVVVIMSSLNSSGTANLPQAIELPGNPLAQVEEDPLFEPIAIDETPSTSDSLDSVAKKIKAQSEKEEEVIVDFISGPEDILEEEVTEVVVPAKYEKPIVKAPKKVITKPTVKKQTKKVVKKPSTKPSTLRSYYVQVGSFGHYAPDKKFLRKITTSGYTYKLHKVGSSTKVLVGPYVTDKAARKDLRAIRNTIETGAFLSRI